MALLRRHPQGVGFYDTGPVRAALGFGPPHELQQALERLKHQGWRVLRGEGFSDSVSRIAHAGRGDHNWQPDKVVLLPRNAVAPGEMLSMGEVWGRVHCLGNIRPPERGPRPRVTGEWTTWHRRSEGAKTPGVQGRQKRR